MNPKNISILLVEPENPDNIGAVARAIKNMGFEELRFVNPPADWKEKGKKMAVSAADVLQNAQEYASVQEAVSDAVLVVGTTRRERRFNPNRIAYKEAIKKIRKYAQSHKVTVMFGKESKGLDNDALNHCDWITSLPVSPLYPSINLAQAVMVLCFTLFYSQGDKTPQAEMGMKGEWGSKKEIFETLAALKTALAALGYQGEPEVLERIIATFHGMMKRAGLLRREEQMLKGISRRIRERVVPKRTKE